jgi:3-hydroxyisobutyrate dehydrogenase
MAAKVSSVAVLGTGIMGSAMARNLARAGLETTAWNRTRERAEPLAGDGVQIADSAADAAAGAEATITMLTNADAVREVITDGGALEAMSGHGIWIQSSTIGISATEEFVGLADQRGVPFLDAPVSGTKQPAEAGQLVVLASGDQEALERCEPVFEAIGQKIVWLGDAGAGMRMKLVTNNRLDSLMAELAETIALAEGLNADPRRFLEVIEGGAMDFPYAHVKGKEMIERSFEPSFPLRHAHKDARLVLEAAERKEIDLPLARGVEQRFREAEEMGYGEEDIAAVFEASTAAASTGARGS